MKNEYARQQGCHWGWNLAMTLLAVKIKKKKVGNTWGDIFSIVQKTNLCPGVDMMIPSSMILNRDGNWT